ncbi:hypothetical protein [Pseudomonas sp. TH10]|uniref:hypothetical protein n=1 Tax=Pseudomonas sp. TH10 TaxID=2796376 RepID=UPI0027DD655E|nr:hypothetical protein [Pseudomonas sp. TH10]
MAAAQQIPVEYLSDKVAEKNFAEMVGTTRRALQGKRQRNIIPKGVWNEIDGQIYYSIRRYEAWLESLWDCPPELNSQVNQSAFASHGSSGAARPSPIPKRQKALKRPQIYALQ